MKRRDVIRLGATGMILAPASGCATLWDLLGRFIKAPDLIIRKMEITGMTLDDISVKFLADLINPNKIGFRLDGLDYLLRLEGDQIAKGRAPKGIDLRPGARAKTELDFTFGLGKTAAAILSFVQKKSVDYEIEMVGKFLQQQGGIDVPASFKGRMPMPELPDIGVKTFRALSVGLSGIAFRVETTVKNNMDFAIPIDGFNFDMKMNGKSVLKNKSTKGLNIAAGKSGSVPLDFNVGLVELGLTLAELAGGKNLSYEMTTSLKSGALVAPFTNKGTVRVSS